MDIVVVKNYHAMSLAGAQLAADQIKKKKSSLLGLATGNTMIGLYRELVHLNHAKLISFSKTKTVNLDEFVGLDKAHRGSLFYFMRKHFFDKVDLDSKNVFFLDTEATDPKKECNEYEAMIKKMGPVDLQFLGIGENGHIAWCEPGISFKSKTSVIKLTLKSRRAQQGNFASLREVPQLGYTMGLSTIMQAKKIVLMVSGKKKAKILAKALSGKITEDVPASILQRHLNLTVILDEEAASALKKKK
ncbi:glucosamine-6-phosphate deaminase [Candidatus Falkowbacteria bacterium]|nr:glucosamine-6-phosphate deaminase [Candidatus Falkowbacteria bacterium]